MTGWFRDGFCRADVADLGQHSVCCVMTESFLSYSKAQGKRPQYAGAGLLIPRASTRRSLVRLRTTLETSPRRWNGPTREA